MNGARYSGLAAALSPLLKGMGAVLMLHHVRPNEGGAGLNRLLHVEPEFLDELLDSLKRGGARFVSMDEVAERLRAGHTDEFFLSVTLDDGCRDNLVHAAPVFRAHEVPFTIYVSPGLTDGDADLWWELLERIVEENDEVAFDTAEGRRVLSCRTVAEKHRAYAALMKHALTEIDEDAQRALTRQLCEEYGIDRDAHRRNGLMAWHELQRIQAEPLGDIGAHTMGHYQLRRLDRERAEREIVRSRDVLAERLGTRPRHLAYPYGGPRAAGAREAEIARAAGFDTAVTTRHGMLMPAHARHMHALPRISVNGNYQRVAYVETMLTGITVPAANLGRRFITV
ncbi:polysaccharide deacetylase family protein [Oricola thermophila]|uniref:Chitooligosaccharide deacetylase n=1 Tax=Oricola thermophila TaxID=2742145 RepID=A0A6N1VGD1_9HYPH|nr:polysaccharide deacetylase family protein [Oricola thermophila]QKV18322.1 polysaccharide deacetylase family protein [Oricola thermophila]